MLTPETTTFEGDYYATRDAFLYDVPDEGVPVYVAAGGPVVAKYAGRVGDGFICTSGKGMELYTDKLLPAVEEGASINERDSSQIDRMIEIKISYDPDPAAALENCRFWAPLSLTPEQKHSVDSPREMRHSHSLRMEEAKPSSRIALNDSSALASTEPRMRSSSSGSTAESGSRASR